MFLIWKVMSKYTTCKKNLKQEFFLTQIQLHMVTDVLHKIY